MRKKPLISVIIPVYNSEKYISGCLDSVIAQTLDDFEIICVNDGSTDDSGVLLEKYARLDARITVINQANGGQSRARNTGLELVSGQYLFFLDSDDYLHPQALELTYNVVQNKKVDMVCAAYLDTKKIYSPINEKVNLTEFSIKLHVDPLIAYATRRFGVHGLVCSKLYRASILKNIRFIPDMTYEDDIFTARAMEACKQIAVIDFKAYYYFYGHQSTTSRPFNINDLESQMQNIQYYCDKFANNPIIFQEVKRSKIKLILSTCFVRINKVQNKDLRLELKKSLKMYVDILMNKGLVKYSDFNWRMKIRMFMILN